MDMSVQWLEHRALIFGMGKAWIIETVRDARVTRL